MDDFSFYIAKLGMVANILISQNAIETGLAHGSPYSGKSPQA